MTNDQAQQIIKYLAANEFPEFHVTSLQFGLFKVSELSIFTSQYYKCSLLHADVRC